MAASPRDLTARQQAVWSLSSFGPPPATLTEWRQSATTLASDGASFLSQPRSSRILYIRMCAADLSNEELFTTNEEMRALIPVWDYLRTIHNASRPPHAAPPPRNSEHRRTPSDENGRPVAGHFAVTDTRTEVHPRAMSEHEVRGIQHRPEPDLAALTISPPPPPQQGIQPKKSHSGLQRPPASGRFAKANARKEVRPRAMSKSEVHLIQHRHQPHFAALSNKATFTAAVAKDIDLVTRISDRLVLPLPTHYEIALAIPQHGISIRDLMLLFARQLSIKTIANFMERAFLITTMDPMAKTLLPVPSLEGAQKLSEGPHREAMMRAARLSQKSQTTGNLKYEAFKSGEFEGHFFDRVRQVKVASTGYRKKQLWYFKSKAADERDMKILLPFLEEAEERGRKKEAKQWAGKKIVSRTEHRRDSVVDRSTAGVVCGKRSIREEYDGDGGRLEKRTKL